MLTRIARSCWEKSSNYDTEHFKECLGINLDYIDSRENSRKKREVVYRNVTPVFYTENPKSLYEKKYSDKGYKSIRDMANQKAISTDSQLSKSSWEKNSSTCTIIFVLDKYYTKTLKALYNALANGKVVYIRTTKKSYRLEDISQISHKFDEAKEERKRKHRLQNLKIRQQEVIKTCGCKKYTQRQKDIINALAYFYELDAPKNASEYRLTWYTVRLYLLNFIKFSKEITENNADIFACIPEKMLHGKVQHIATFAIVDVELFGNVEIFE